MANADVKWVDVLPDQRSGKSNMTRIRADLLSRPGTWAEIQRYRSKNSAYSRGVQYTGRHPEMEYAVRADGDDWVLYMRAIAASE